LGFNGEEQEISSPRSVETGASLSQAAKVRMLKGCGYNGIEGLRIKKHDKKFPRIGACLSQASKLFTTIGPRYNGEEEEFHTESPKTNILEYYYPNRLSSRTREEIVSRGSITRMSRGSSHNGEEGMSTSLFKSTRSMTVMGPRFNAEEYF